MVQSGRQQSDTCTARSRRRFPGRTFYDLDDGEGLRFGPRPAGLRVRSLLGIRHRRMGMGQSFDRLCARRRGAVRQSGRKGYGLDCGCWRRLRHHRKRFCAHRISLHQSCHCGLCECGNQFGRPSHSGAGQRFARRYRIQVRHPRRGEFLIGLSAVLAEIRVQITPGTRAPALSLFMDVRVAATRSMCALAVGLLARKRWKSAALSTRS